MTRIKTSELSGPALDWAVAMAVGMKAVSVGYEGTEDETPEQKILPEWFREVTDNSVGDYFVDYDARTIYANGRNNFVPSWAPSTDWRQGGALIESNCVFVECTDPHYQPDARWWQAAVPERSYCIGPTPLIAACRAIVSANMGDEVDVPDELAEVAA